MPNNNDNYEYMKFLDLSGAQQIWNTCKQTFVQTVNGVGIDANGNVNVSVGASYKHNLFIEITGTGQQRDWKSRLSLLIENNSNTPITTWQDIYNYMVSKNIDKLRASGQIYSNRPINLAWIGYEMSNNQVVIDFYGVNMTTYNNDGTGQFLTSLEIDTTIEDVIL